MRAIIIGSGIAGLSTAIALQRIGIEVTIYERAPMLTEVGAGISLWANAIQALDSLGAKPDVLAASLPLARSEFRVSCGHHVAISYSAAELEQRLGVSPVLVMVHRADLVGMLAKCLPSSVAHYGFECVGIEAEHEHVKVRFQNGYTDTADLLIGADGINSVVRRSLFGRVEPRYAGYTCWRGICRRPTSLADGYVAEWWGRGRRFGIGALPNERIYWWATENTAAGGHTDDQRHLIEAFHDWAEPVPELIATTPVEKILRNDIVDRPPDRRWVSGRAVLVGDAAHPTTPNLGQGGCMAIEDAVVLGRWLQQGGEIRRVLESFVAERFDRTASITRTSWHFGWLGQADGRLTSWLRDRILRIVMPFAGPQSLLRYAQFNVGSLAPSRER